MWFGNRLTYNMVSLCQNVFCLTEVCLQLEALILTDLTGLGLGAPFVTQGKGMVTQGWNHIALTL